jgi:putative ABC transport system permease protein
MNPLKLAWKNLWHNRLRSLLSLVLFATGVAIILTLVLTGEQLSKNLKKNRAGVDMVVSSPGSKIQMILSSVYHIDNPTGNVDLDEVAFLFKNPTIDAYPISLGDNYKGVRIVGTDKRYIKLYGGQISKGKLWEKELQAVLGSEVAKKFKLKVGDKITGSHGLVAGNQDSHDEHPYTVVGILKPTHSVLDKLILCHFASVWKVHEGHDHSHGGHNHNHGGHNHSEHDHSGHDHETKHGNHSDDDHAEHDHNHGGHAHSAHKHEEGSHEGHDHNLHEKEGEEETPKEKARRLAKEKARENAKKKLAEQGIKAKSHEILTYTKQNKSVTAVLVNINGSQAINFLPRHLDTKEGVDYAMVEYETGRLYPLIEPGVAIVKWIAIFIVFISAFSIWISLFQSLKERKYELALLRVMGGTQFQLFLVVLLEGILLSFLGFLAGFLIAHGITHYLGIGMALDYNIEMTGWYFSPVEWLVFYGAIALGIIAAILPSVLATRINIPKTLANK